MSTKQTVGETASLGEFEHVVLLSALRLRNEAYAPRISEVLEREAGRRVSRGALYATLGRLEQKGLLRWELEEPGEERGGHARRRFELTSGGLAALRAHREVLLRLWSSVERVLDGGPV